MKNVIPFNPRGNKPKPTCQGHLFVDDPAGGACWAEILDYGEYVVVRMLRPAPLKRYIVDSVEEAFKLGYRLAGYPNAQARKIPKSSHYDVTVGLRR